MLHERIKKATVQLCIGAKHILVCEHQQNTAVERVHVACGKCCRLFQTLFTHGDTDTDTQTHTSKKIYAQSFKNVQVIMLIYTHTHAHL